MKCVDCGIEVNDKRVPLYHECYEKRLIEKSEQTTE